MENLTTVNNAWIQISLTQNVGGMGWCVWISEGVNTYRDWSL